jgi:hypothetical protein
VDLTEPGPRPLVSEQSSDYQLRFRYQLWSQGAQDFRSRPAAPRGFASAGRNSAAADINPRSAERGDALDSEAMPTPYCAG